MATWDFEKSDDKTCAHCGTTYEVKYHQVPVKDIDSFDCLVCGQELDSWKSTRYPIFTLKNRAPWPRDETKQ